MKQRHHQQQRSISGLARSAKRNGEENQMRSGENGKPGQQQQRNKQLNAASATCVATMA